MEGTGSTVIESGAKGSIETAGGAWLSLVQRTFINRGTLTAPKEAGITGAKHALMLNVGTFILNGETEGEEHGLISNKEEAKLINTGTIKKNVKVRWQKPLSSGNLKTLEASWKKRVCIKSQMRSARLPNGIGAMGTLRRRARKTRNVEIQLTAPLATFTRPRQIWRSVEGVSGWIWCVPIIHRPARRACRARLGPVGATRSAIILWSKKRRLRCTRRMAARCRSPK